MAKVAINGLGRIGRAVMKILLDTPQLDLVAVNDIVPAENIAYLIKYDTVYGRYTKSVEVEDGALIINGERYPYLSEKDPTQLPWDEMDVDIVFECTGIFGKLEDLKKHVQAGAKHVILSAPAKSEEIATVVHGVNTESGDMQIISCASCTTNSITPMVEIMGRRIGIKKAMLTTIHAYTSTQSIVDSPSKKVRRGRAGAANLVPTSTGAAIATTKAIPEYAGRFDGVAVRTPVTVGSISDIVFMTDRETTVEEVNQIFEEEARSDRYRDIIAVQHDPIVSSDIIGDAHACVIDAGMTTVVDGDMVKVMGWYDNEWGYSNQMVREAVAMAKEPAR
ncbi:MAG: type I glyceraldehyde-3-phosphate dehydrogenase [Chloroflexota bacterium]